MFVIGHFINALAIVADLALTLYMYILIIGAILSWVNPDPYNPIVRFINNVTEPVLRQVRRYLPVSFSGIDFSPVVVIFAIVFLQNFFVQSLRSLAFRLLH
ncbi:YggT family protein [Desulfatibacillum alkenivorans DSM 16219]|jgi:YggT family protein|uniref:YggT family protein n=1 Tax=Desulfatibacillum alkenivorans DSM 16219 TaxID=1121393 RepID=A0A1M6WNH4_9BACT|nr:YggT family protein [Desulfatibacillum alkenivorans]SHK95196.1 YggT family protein [Desulfatibacillum alkenivorans DSM 16219]